MITYAVIALLLFVLLFTMHSAMNGDNSQSGSETVIWLDMAWRVQSDNSLTALNAAGNFSYPLFNS